MDKMITLLSGDYSLLFTVNKATNWCIVQFHSIKNNTSTLLGADDFVIICSRLHSVLKKERLNDKETFIHGDFELFWILSLFEQHASIYGSVTNSLGIRIFCVEDGGNYLPELHLTMIDVQRWLAILGKELKRSQKKKALGN